MTRILVPDPTPARPSQSESSPTSTTWPVGSLPSGTRYVLAQTGVYAIDAGSGLVTNARLPVDSGADVLTPMSYGVLLWSHEGGLFALDVSTLSHVYPGPVERRDDTDLAAVGPDGYERGTPRAHGAERGCTTAPPAATPP